MALVCGSTAGVWSAVNRSGMFGQDPGQDRTWLRGLTLNTSDSMSMHSDMSESS